MKNTETIMWKEINETACSFDNIIMNNKQTIEKLANEIKKSGKNNFMLCARGTSYHALMYFKYMIEINAPYTAGYVAPSVITLYEGKIDFSRSIFIACSQSGMALDVSESMKVAKKQGALTIAITNDENSLLAKQADYHLFCSCGEEVSVAATKTYSAQLFISFWLTALLSENKEMLNKVEKLSKMMRDNNAVLDSYTTEFSKAGLIEMKGGFVLARGITYSIAFEQALKLQETSYKQMKGYATSDFYHGPVAMVNKETPVIMYFAKGEKKFEENIRADQKKMIEKILTTSGPILMITDDSVLAKEYAEKAKIALLPNSLGEECAIFNFAMFAQMLACKVSCGVGNNPDSPRALNKITITK